jgi:hypothetical protein
MTKRISESRLVIVLGVLVAGEAGSANSITVYTSGVVANDQIGSTTTTVASGDVMKQDPITRSA